MFFTLTRRNENRQLCKDKPPSTRAWHDFQKRLTTGIRKKFCSKQMTFSVKYKQTSSSKEQRAMGTLG